MKRVYLDEIMAQDLEIMLNSINKDDEASKISGGLTKADCARVSADLESAAEIEAENTDDRHQIRAAKLHGMACKIKTLVCLIF